MFVGVVFEIWVVAGETEGGGEVDSVCVEGGEYQLGDVEGAHGGVDESWLGWFTLEEYFDCVWVVGMLVALHDELVLVLISSFDPLTHITISLFTLQESLLTINSHYIHIFTYSQKDNQLQPGTTIE